MERKAIYKKSRDGAISPRHTEVHGAQMYGVECRQPTKSNNGLHTPWQVINRMQTNQVYDAWTADSEGQAGAEKWSLRDSRQKLEKRETKRGSGGRGGQGRVWSWGITWSAVTYSKLSL